MGAWSSEYFTEEKVGEVFQEITYVVEAYLKEA